ncbi:Hypothetical_protein [Hexamita inflata]|uniref:Hypothetical_protein n=1 Tax=Hexamita inflata TaxID=28002 RepID=A0AA86UJ74_9EUKA|nr:Hypothetical protein HINF_LOCUS29703 [Hexamita inflata]
MNTCEQDILTIISDYLKYENSADQQRLIFHVLMLSQMDYDKLFAHISFVTNVCSKQLQIIFKQMTHQKFYIQETQNVVSQVTTDLTAKRQQLKQSWNDIQFEQLFVKCVKIILELEQTEINNIQLCQLVDNYLKANKSITFWNRLSSLITKTPTQLRQYFTKSFRKYLFVQCLSDKDKYILKELIQKYVNMKPGEIADQLEQISGNNYFRRNVIMFIVQNKAKK